MKKLTSPLFFILTGLSAFAHADYNSPADSNVPPETFEQQVPPPPAPPPPPESTQENPPTHDTPSAVGDGSGDDSDTLHDPDPEKDDVGTTPTQPS